MSPVRWSRLPLVLVCESQCGMEDEKASEPPNCNVSALRHDEANVAGARPQPAVVRANKEEFCYDR